MCTELQGLTYVSLFEIYVPYVFSKVFSLGIVKSIKAKTVKVKKKDVQILTVSLRNNNNDLQEYNMVWQNRNNNTGRFFSVKDIFEFQTRFNSVCLFINFIERL